MRATTTVVVWSGLVRCCLADFATTATGFDKQFVGKLHKFRTTGNSNAHSIDIHVKKNDVDALKSDLTHIVKLLSAVYDKTPPA